MNHLRFASRQLLKSPGFTATAVLSLALGIGAATTLFSVLQALVLDPFPYPRSGEIVYVRSNGGQPLSFPDFRDLRERNRSFVDFGVYRPARINLGAQEAESLAAIQCTAGVLRALGSRPALGRWLDEADDQPGAAPVAVISHGLWLRAFGGDASIVGRTARLDGRPTEIVGVMPADFEFSSPSYAGQDYQAWLPLHGEPNDLEQRGNHWLLGVARLKPDVPLATADADVKAIGAQLAAQFPDTNTHKPMLVRSLRQEITRDTASGMKPLGGAVALLLLVGCANVAGLLLARGTRRQGEFAIRLAIGASRPALVRQLLTEALLLGLLGCAVGVLLAAWGTDAVRQLIPSSLVIEARRAAIALDGRVLAFATATGFVAALIAGAVPALTAAHGSVAVTLNDAGRTQTGSRLRRRFLRNLVMAQAAVAVVLAYAAILFTASYLKVFETNRALDTDRVLTAEVAPQGERYRAVAARVRFWNTLIERVRVLPGVEQAALTSKLPLEGGSNFDVLIDEQKFDPKVRRPLVENTGVSPGYFRAMGLGWLRGQPADFTRWDGPDIPVVINQTMARQCWPDTDPLGHRIRINSARSPFQFHVVGVVEDVRQWGAETSPRPELYYACSLAGTPEEALPEESAYLVVRTSGEARAVAALIRHELALTDGDLALSNVRTMGEVLHQAGSRRRLSAGLINAFTAMALLLAAVGIYGTLSCVIAERTREIGVRIVIGAQPRQILGLVGRQASAWLLGGLVPGIALSAACSLALRSLVYGADPLDPLVLLSGAGLVGGVLLAACIGPARRALRVNPVEALRAE
ncbi:ABC transporter permease [Opitutus terrae]|uniref:Permease n=1 Tax=Opitutus terrae (strain DSM 11246 / JCM 15787 / PB90-1) TaxID=452637 RepID=B1ZXV8_OPITP|nr:ABC transporter permease [Opitutus terrae]ACB75160.1 permease [Opitutus terrae PB90-1]